LCCDIGIAASSIEEKLKVETDFLPAASRPVDQLVEIARRFKIPMAIEWVETADNTESSNDLQAANRTVKSLIHLVIGSGYVARIQNGLLHIYSPAVASHPFNFLNIRLNYFDVNHGDLFEAVDRLRWGIRFTLEPEDSRDCYLSSYGHGANDVFEIPKFSIHASNLTVRQALNRIAKAQGNALWLARIKKSHLNRNKPYWKTNGADGGEFPITAGWNFLPLSDLSELARERVVVDLSIKDFGEMRVAELPVMMDQGLYDSSSGGGGGSASSGVSYTYGVAVKQVTKEFVTLVVLLTVSRNGESELKFEEPVDVFRGRITELRPISRVTLKASIESITKP
jgi:hypothetical protein